MVSVAVTRTRMCAYAREDGVAVSEELDPMRCHGVSTTMFYGERMKGKERKEGKEREGEGKDDVLDGFACVANDDEVVRLGAVIDPVHLRFVPTCGSESQSCGSTAHVHRVRHGARRDEAR